MFIKLLSLFVSKIILFIQNRISNSNVDPVKMLKKKEIFNIILNYIDSLTQNIVENCKVNIITQCGAKIFYEMFHLVINCESTW